MAAQPAVQLAAGDAGGDGDDHRCGLLCESGQVGADLAHHLRLDRHHPQGSAGNGRHGIGDGGHAKVPRQRRAQCRDRLSDADAGRGHAAADQPGDQAAGHVAAADEGDAVGRKGR
jgi:hypothetical protein